MSNVFKSLGIDKIVIASTNIQKIEQIKNLDFFNGIEVLSTFDFDMDEVEETEDTLEGNAFLKARACYKSTGLPSLADDTGFFMNALDGFPGVHCARIAEVAGGARDYHVAAKIINDKLGDNPDRSCTFSAVLAFVANGLEYIWQGNWHGTFVYPAMMGDDNRVYNPYFMPRGMSHSYAQGGYTIAYHRMTAIQNLIKKMELSISEAS